MLSMRGPTLPFALMKTYGPISIDLKEKRIEKNSLSLSILTLTLPSHFVSFLLTSHFSFFILLFYFIFFLFLSCVHLSFWSVSALKKFIYFSVQFILNEFSSNHFLTFKIFVKISSLKSLATYHPENCKNILIVSELNETFLGH